MPIFGEIINTKIPVLITFYADWHTSSDKMSSILREVAIIIGDNAKIIKMSVDENKELTKAFHIGGLPTYVLYYRGDLVWREEGIQSTEVLVEKIQNFLN